ncbi:MAG: hypothetical protein JWM33_92 [Caulobacteraceae bacterium]|nr:hypothetical protein [Caulobacteraceae bacterium]
MLEELRSRWRRAPSDALAAAKRRRNELRHAARVSAAVGAAFAISAIFHLPQGGYWAIFTAVLVVQSSLGGTLNATRERLLGAVVGGGAGVLTSLASTAMGLHAPWQHGLVLCALVALLTLAAAIKPVLKVAPVTAVIILLVPTVGMSPWLSALLRAVDILIGGLAGVAAVLLVFPARAHTLTLQRLCAAMTEIAGLIDLERANLEGDQDEPVGFERHRSVRQALAAIESSMNEADHERAAWLSDKEVPEALLRTVWRARSDCVGIGHALAAVPKGAALDHLRPSASALLSAQSARLRLCATGLKDRRKVERGALLATDAAFEASMTELRSSGATMALSTDEAAGLLGLVFVMAGLTTNLEDLADRVDELADDAEA